MSNLTTTEKGSLVGAVNELNSNTGDLSTLKTTTKTSVVGAINELKTGLQFYAGSTVVTGNGANSYPLWTKQQVANMFGVQNPDQYFTFKVTALLTNGEGNSNGIHINGSQWYSDNGTLKLFATFNSTTNIPVRINYVLFYAPNAHLS